MALAVIRSLRRLDVVLVTLDPSVGREIHKTRPCAVVSPDEANRHLRTILVAPMTTGGHPYPTRVATEFDGVAGYVVLDQMRTVDLARVVRRLGALDTTTQAAVLAALHAYFAT